MSVLPPKADVLRLLNVCQGPKRTIGSSGYSGDKKLGRNGKVASLSKATLQHGEHGINSAASSWWLSRIADNGFDHPEQTSLRICFGQHL